MNSYRDVLLRSFPSANNASSSAPPPGPAREQMPAASVAASSSASASSAVSLPDMNSNRHLAKNILFEILQSERLNFDQKMAKLASLPFFQHSPDQLHKTKAFCGRYRASPEALHICLTNCLFLQNLLVIDDAKRALDFIFYYPRRRDVLNRINDYTYYNIDAYTTCAAQSCDSHYVDIFVIAKSFQAADSNTLAALNIFVEIIKRNKDVHRVSLLISRNTLAHIFMEAPFLLVQQYVESLKELDPRKESVRYDTRNFIVSTVDDVKVLPTIISHLWKAVSNHQESDIRALTLRIDLYWDMVNSALNKGILSNDEVDRLRESIPAMVDDSMTMNLRSRSKSP
jgi:hypothetical protein